MAEPIKWWPPSNTLYTVYCLLASWMVVWKIWLSTTLSQNRIIKLFATTIYLFFTLRSSKMQNTIVCVFFLNNFVNFATVNNFRSSKKSEYAQISLINYLFCHKRTILIKNSHTQRDIRLCQSFYIAIRDFQTFALRNSSWVIQLDKTAPYFIITVNPRNASPVVYQIKAGLIKRKFIINWTSKSCTATEKCAVCMYTYIIFEIS